MKVVPPIAITAANMTSNVPLMDFDAYSLTKSYLVGDSVTINNINWEALIANTGKNPETDKSSPPIWLNKGATNRWKMFNKRVGNTWTLGSFTSNAESIDVSITPAARINSFGLVGVRASSVRVVMTVPGTADPVYDKTFAMSAKAGGSWYQYYFGEFTTKDNVAQFDLPPFNNATVRFIVSAPGGTARVGMLVVGMSRDIGWARFGSGVSIESYSTIKEDDFGGVTITPKGKRRVVDFDIGMYANKVSSALRVLEPLSDTAALYIGAVSADWSITIGRFDRLALINPNVALAEYSLEVRSLM
ncbi:hypothetical protein LS633_25150 [Pseudomonas sp. NIBR-H-19]|uniref:hypothetical protein n=1 Tax=Pseudomonas sp. NIBR-H-19 TaxID=2901380 RepID=UPI001E2B2C53|nr:hypothetical protein [Pseudomonas sp. NIBR-H-19]UHC81655.1 hypothetical protein LS633_25150 [Pseudomonas sp. NIBR-H-19]